jgi:PTS system nitrogen regulatory IIA component
VATTADRLAAEHAAELTFVRVIGADDDETEAQAYLDQMGQMIQINSKSEILHGDDVSRTISKFSAAYDLLVTHEPKASFVGQLLGLQQNTLTDGAACSVLRLQTPRVETHHAVRVAAGPAKKIRLTDLLEPQCMAASLPKKKKDALFAIFAQSFANAIPGLDASVVLARLLARERSQNTAVGIGVALPHATVSSATRTHLGVFTTEAPIDYKAPDGEGVQFFFATIGPASERQTHLHLLAMVSGMALKTNLLQQLRGANNADEIRAALDQAQAQLDADA